MDSGKLKEKFRNLKTEISGYYQGTRYKLLRCCLYGIVHGAELDKTQVGAYLFNALEFQGIISPIDVKLLSEITELTNVKNAIDCVNKYKRDNNVKDSGSQILKPYRRGLVKALMWAGDDDLKNVVANYAELNHFKLENIWDAVFKLERERLLEDDEDKLRRFAGLLQNDTKKQLIGEIAVSGAPQQMTIPGASTSSEILPNQQDESEAVNSRDQQLFFKELSQDNLIDLLEELSMWWKEFGNINMLKVLLEDFNEIDDAMIVKADDAVKLFKLLQAHGHLTSSNIDILIEICKLCGLLGVKSVIEKYVPEFKIRGFKDFKIRLFSKHRQSLVKFGKTIKTEAKGQIARLFQVHIEEKEDQWVLIYKLEQMNRLINDKKTKDEFIERLLNVRLTKEANALKGVP